MQKRAEGEVQRSHKPRYDKRAYDFKQCLRRTYVADAEVLCRFALKLDRLDPRKPQEMRDIRAGGVFVARRAAQPFGDGLRAQAGG